MRRKFGFTMLLFLSCLASACEMQPGVATVQPTAVEREAYAYRIGPEDVLMISVWQNKDISNTVPVRPDGMISLPLLNDVQAAGLTPEQLRGVLIKRLKEYIPKPEVSVIVAQVHSPKISVLGNVARPSRYVISSKTTVLDALALAGGLTEFASRKRIVILRPEGTMMTQLLFNYNAVVAAEGDSHNFYLQPGDIVLVR